MRIARAIFFVLYALFHAMVLWFSFKAYNADLRDLLELRKFIPYAPLFALSGLFFFVINFWLYFYFLNRRQRRINFLEQERTTFKAKMFDLEKLEDSEETDKKAVGDKP